MEQHRFAQRPILNHLRQVVADAQTGTAQSPELRRTLDALARTGFPAKHAEAFWRAAGEPNDNVRRTWLRALMALIELAFTPTEAIAAE